MRMPLSFADIAGRKYGLDGLPQPFPGCTVVAFLRPGDEETGVGTDEKEGHVTRATAVAAARLFADALPDGSSSWFRFLPPETLHMTVFDLLCEKARGGGDEAVWAGAFPACVDGAQEQRFAPGVALATQADASLAMQERTEPILDTWSGGGESTSDSGSNGGRWAADVRLRVRTLSTAGFALKIVLEADGPDAEDALRSGLRDDLAVATGVRKPSHEHYAFHVTLAYQVVDVDANPASRAAVEDACTKAAASCQGRSIALDAPVFSIFDDMETVRPAARLRRLAS
jgi:hypothetical protein